MAKNAKLSPAMQAMMRALETYGNIDPIRDLGRRAGGGKMMGSTIVALMDRGILREASARTGHVHFPTTTPEQVWDEAHAEDARRTAERASTDREDWVQTVDDEGADHHLRGMRTGGLIRVCQVGFRHWLIFFPGQQGSMSASGTWAEARRAADRFERNQAHAEALAEHAQWEIDQAAAVQATPAYRRFDAAVHEGLSYRAALDILHAEALEMARDRDLGELISAERRRLMAGGTRFALADRMALNNVMSRLHAEALEYVAREQHIAQSGVAHVRNNCPALAVGGCMKCTAPATVCAARGDDSAYGAELEGWGQPEGMLATTPAELTIEDCTHGDGCPVHPDTHVVHNFDVTPAEAHTGMSDRTAAALADVALMQRLAEDQGGVRHIEAMARIERALRNH